MRETTEQLPNRVTMTDIMGKVKSTEYIRLKDGVTTICNITLQNGFSVRGESACVDPGQFNLALGEKIAFDNAIDKIWLLEGYLLKQRRHEAGL